MRPLQGELLRSSLASMPDAVAPFVEGGGSGLLGVSAADALGGTGGAALSTLEDAGDAGRREAGDAFEGTGGAVFGSGATAVAGRARSGRRAQEAGPPCPHVPPGFVVIAAAAVESGLGRRAANGIAKCRVRAAAPAPAVELDAVDVVRAATPAPSPFTPNRTSMTPPGTSVRSAPRPCRRTRCRRRRPGCRPARRGRCRRRCPLP